MDKELFNKIQELLTEARDLVKPYSIYTANDIENIQISLHNKTQ